MSKKPGSKSRSALDADIDFAKSEANDIEGFLKRHESICRIVFPQNSAVAFLTKFKSLIQGKGPAKVSNGLGMLIV